DQAVAQSEQALARRVGDNWVLETGLDFRKERLAQAGEALAQGAGFVLRRGGEQARKLAARLFKLRRRQDGGLGRGRLRRGLSFSGGGGPILDLLEAIGSQRLRLP